MCSSDLEVKVALDEPIALFKPEMLVDVTYLAPKLAEAATDVSDAMRLYVPQQLVHRDEGGSFVWVADQSAGVARKTPITTRGIATGGLVEITSGLNVASRVIARGQEELSDRDRIEVIRENADLVASGDPVGTTRQPLSRLPREGE